MSVAALSLLILILGAAPATAPAPASPDLPALYEATRPAVLRVHGPSGNGTAFVVGDGSIAATAWHVLSGGGPYFVEDINGVQVEAELLRFDKDNDIALLTLPPREAFAAAAPLPLAERLPIVGEPLFAIGHPLVTGKAPNGDHEGLLTWSLTAGITSQVGTRQIQTTASLQPGNSGGPLFNGAGEVVGVVVQRHGDFGTATRLEHLVKLMESKEKVAPRPRFGLGLQAALLVEALPGQAGPARGRLGFGAGATLSIERRVFLGLGVRQSWMLAKALRAEGQRRERLEVVFQGGPELRARFKPGSIVRPLLRPYLLGGVLRVSEGLVEERLQYVDPGCDPSSEPCLVNTNKETTWQRAAHPLLGVGLNVGLGTAFAGFDLGLSLLQPKQQFRLSFQVGVRLRR